MNWLIHNGRIIDPINHVDRFGDVVVERGRIFRIGDALTALPEDCGMLDAAGMVVCPGFIDIHCHLRQPGFEEKENVATGMAAAARGGFTTICCMPNTRPALDTPGLLQQIQSVARQEGAVRVLPIGAITVDRKGEKLADLTALHKAGAVAFSDDGNPVIVDNRMREALRAVMALHVPIIDHCERPELSADGAMNEGALARRLGYPGIPVAAEESMVERDIVLARETGGWIHIAHVSTAGSVELIRRAKADGVHVTAEATPHHLTLTEERVRTHGTAAKVNPPLRMESDRLALVAGLRDGTIDAIATDHAPHTAADKRKPFTDAAFGISGLETAVGSLMGLVRAGEVDLVTLMAALTRGPARIIAASERGSLTEGAIADITVFDPEASWTVEPDRFASKGKNTPLAGDVLYGQIIATLVAGRIAYRGR